MNNGERKDERKDECEHNWEHLYDFARCRICGEDMDIPTASDHANDT